jgi:hypothetical protein
MTIPPMPTPEVIFLIFVVACFAVFAVTLASVHLYVNLAPVRRPKSKTAAPRAARHSSPATPPAGLAWLKRSSGSSG